PSHVLGQLLAPGGDVERTVLRPLFWLLLQVVAGANRTARTEEDHDPGPIVGSGPSQRGGELLHHGSRDRVQHLWAIERETPDRSDVLFQDQGLARHVRHRSLAIRSASTATHP